MCVIEMGGVTPVFAQVTYSVFPAVPQQASAAQGQPTGHSAMVVTLAVQDSTVAYTVHELAHQAHLRVSYNSNNPVFAKRVSVQVVNADVMDALTVVLKGTGLVARLAPDGETVMIRAQAGSSPTVSKSLAGGTITGRVSDSASGAGLGGASIKIAGTKLAAVTSDSGHFTLKDVPSGDQVLTVRLFGYKPAERTVTVVDSEQTTVRIVMVPVPTVLSGVVTTATGLQRKIEVGNDITSINVDSVMKVTPIMSVTDLLETRVPGLTVLHSSGVPGDPSRLRLRGAGSILLDNDPIVVIDGVRVYASQSDRRNSNLAPNALTGGGTNIGLSTFQEKYAAPSPLDQVDPNDIATIEVFKGPSASALYGSDAANGVIVVTTKHGRAGPTTWNLALGQGVNWLPGTWPTNLYRLNHVDSNYTVECNWLQTGCSYNEVIPFQALNDPRYTVFSHGSDQTASLTVSGGVPTLRYSVSGSAAGDVGNLKLPGIEKHRYETLYGPVPGWMLRPDNYQTWGGSGSLTAQPSPTVQVTLSSSLFNSTQQRSSLENAIAQLEGEYIDANGVYVSRASNPGFNSIQDLATTPLILNDVERATAGTLTSTNALTMNWQPRPWLPLTATAGLNTMQRTDNTYIPYGVNNSGPGCTLCLSSDTTGSYGLGRGTSHNQTLTAGTAIPLFRQHMTLAVGGNVYSQSTADFTAYTNQLAPGVSVPTSFPTSGNNVNTTFSQATSAASTYGWYVEPRLNLASRFFAAPGFRLDGGSGGSHVTNSSGSVGGLSAFPKLDLSYIAVDRQNSHPLWGMLTLLRPRVAFGLAGTQPGPADRLRLLNAGSSSLLLPLSDTTIVPVVTLNTLGNTQLRPERSSELEGGFDATLWRGRLSLTYTQYTKTRKDAILQIPVAPSVAGNGLQTFVFLDPACGFNCSGVGISTNYEKNIGTVRNTGTELTMTAQLVESRALSWTVGANLSNDNNLLVRLNPGQPSFCTTGDFHNGGTCLVPGYPLFGEWERSIVGFADANHDGLIEPNELRLGDSAVYVGQPSPKYQVNLTTGVTLLNGRLSVNATFAYQNGLTQNNLGALNSGGFLLLGNKSGTPLATQAAIVAAECATSGFFAGGCDGTDIGLVQTVNTFRFNDLSINYELPKGVSSVFRMPRMTVALQGSNLGLHTNYRGKDPSVNAFSTVSAGDETADVGQIPEPRTWWLKVSCGN